jgi:hypothetical protein
MTPDVPEMAFAVLDARDPIASELVERERAIIVSVWGEDLANLIAVITDHVTDGLRFDVGHGWSHPEAGRVVSLVFELPAGLSPLEYFRRRAAPARVQ